jgi:cell division protein FtsB
MKRSFRLIKNKYFLSTLILLVILIAFEDTNIYRQFKSLNKLSALQEVNVLKRIEIEEIKVKINELTTNPQELEKFARETYRMKKENEVIFLFVEESKQ